MSWKRNWWQLAREKWYKLKKMLYICINNTFLLLDNHSTSLKLVDDIRGVCKDLIDGKVTLLSFNGIFQAHWR